jgi:hypothetical protein
MKKFAFIALLSVGVAVAVPAFAHHSSAAMDSSRTVTVDGVVKEFRWGNPHCWLDVEVPDAKGAIALWSFEMTSPQILARAGWKSTTIKFGDKVKVVGNPMRNGDPGGLFVRVTLPDGKVMSQQGEAPTAGAGGAAPGAGGPPRGGGAPRGGAGGPAPGGAAPARGAGPGGGR